MTLALNRLGVSAGTFFCCHPYERLNDEKSTCFDCSCGMNDNAAMPYHKE